MWLSVSCSSYRSRESRIERNSKYRRHIELPTAGIVILRPDLASCHFSDRCTDCTESLGQLRDLTYSARSYSSERADQGGKGKEGEGREGFRHFFFSMDGKKQPLVPPWIGKTASKPKQHFDEQGSGPFHFDEQSVWFCLLSCGVLFQRVVRRLWGDVLNLSPLFYR